MSIARTLLRRIAIGTGIYCLSGVTILAWPVSGYLLAAMVFTYLVHRRHGRRLTTLGSARWANARDLRAAGMLGAKSGLILGRIAGTKELVRLPQATHSLIVGPTGSGKGASLIIPYLLSCPEPCVILDYKGELSQITAAHRKREFGHRIVLLDPYGVVTQSPDSFNPIDFIKRTDPQAIDDCNELADALVVRSGNEPEKHWNDSACAYIAAVIATVVQYGETNTRSLQTVREILSQPEKLEMATKVMIESEMWGGSLRQMGGQLRIFADREKSSVLTTTLRHLRFLGTPAISQSTSTSSFDPGDLRKHGRISIYLTVPPNRAPVLTGLLRMWTSALLRACVRGGLE